MNHLGLHSARKSYRHRRSPKNAYILVLGCTGSGKSSAINLLFDNPNVARVGHEESTTSDIHEFRIPIPIDELGIANSELRVIDTPGLGDTRGLEQDARFLATLDNFLSTHEELKERIPNLVIIVQKFNDNRFDGPGAFFVKMIRGFDAFRKRITDETFSNVVFLFTHYMSVDRAERRRPDKRIKRFQQVIQENSLLPRPTHAVLAENKGKEEQLPMINGYFTLPNGDYYPRNLFEKMDLITQKCNDPIGQGVFRTAFRNSENFNVSRVTYPLMSSNSTLAQQYLGVLTYADLNVTNTEVARHLTSVWASKMDSKLKERHPYSLAYLQKALNLRNINNLEDVPQITSNILELYGSLKQDPATRSLLEIGLGIEAPVFPVNTLAGYGYHVFQDKALPMSPFVMDQLQHSSIGFRIPNTLSFKPEVGIKENFAVFQNKSDYLQHRLQSLGIQGNISVDNFTNFVQPGCNIEALSFREDGCTVTASQDYRLFELVLNSDWTLAPEFENAVRNLTPVKTTDYESVAKWTEFFNLYGTHVVQSTFGGGSIQIQLESDAPFSPSFGKAMFRMVKFADDLNYEMEYGSSPGEIEGNNATATKEDMDTSEATDSTEHFRFSTIFVGGDPTFHSPALGEMSLTDAGKLMTNWKKSLRVNPAMMTTEIELIPISRVVEKLGQNYSEEIDRATQLLFNSDLIFKPSEGPGGPGFSREATPEMVEMLKTMQQRFAEIEQMKQFSMNSSYALEHQRIELEKLRIQAQMNTTIEDGIHRRALERDKLRMEQKRWNQTLERDALQRDHELQMSSLNKQHEERSQNRSQSWDERRMNMTLANKIKEMEEEAKAKAAEKGGCLQAGTLILMADGSEKPVELLKVGDLLLDINMRPTKVLGVAREFLLGQRFYGFQENGPFFFTSNHLFVGPSENYGELQYRAVEPASLFRLNPLMKYKNVLGIDKNVSLYGWEMGKLKSFGVAGIFEQKEQLQDSTVMYDIQVDSPTGTYFANGYVCSHEVPPLEIWPKTISALIHLLDAPVFQNLLPKLAYTVDNVKRIHVIVETVGETVSEFLKSWSWTHKDSEKVKSWQAREISELKDVNTEETISQLFNSSCASTVALQLYAKVGPAIAQKLDLEMRLTPTEISELQFGLYNLINSELTKHLA